VDSDSNGLYRLLGVGSVAVLLCPDGALVDGTPCVHRAGASARGDIGRGVPQARRDLLVRDRNFRRLLVVVAAYQADGSANDVAGTERR